jgi:hypothetical protein
VFVPKHLLRIDGISPTMNRMAWPQLERVLLENDLNPILAVVPDTRGIPLMLSHRGLYDLGWLDARRDEL